MLSVERARVAHKTSWIESFFESKWKVPLLIFLILLAVAYSLFFTKVEPRGPLTHEGYLAIKYAVNENWPIRPCLEFGSVPCIDISGVSGLHGTKGDRFIEEMTTLVTAHTNREYYLYVYFLAGGDRVARSNAYVFPVGKWEKRPVDHKAVLNRNTQTDAIVVCLGEVVIEYEDGSKIFNDVACNFARFEFTADGALI